MDAKAFFYNVMDGGGIGDLQPAPMRVERI